MKKETNRIYGLDGLRFFSFLMVVINHVYGYLEYFGYVHHKPAYIVSTGVFAIQYFFAGSGFLITYMLYAEKETTGAFHLGKFYMRRILRIWPGYYVLLLLTFFVIYTIPFFYVPSIFEAFLPYQNKEMLIFFLFLPQIIPYTGMPGAPYLGHTYTIGIEEQFYLLWAIVFKFFYKNFRYVLASLLLIGLGLNIFNYYYHTYTILHTEITNKLSVFADYYDYSRITTFCIGSFLAFWFKSNHKSLHIFKSVPFQLFFYVISACIIYINFKLPLLNDEFKTILVCILLLIAAYKQTSIINFSLPALEYLGKISYGVYLFHLIAIALVVKILDGLRCDLTQFSGLMIAIICSCILSILFGILSFHTIETWFLRFKKKYDFKKVVKTKEIDPEIEQ